MPVQRRTIDRKRSDLVESMANSARRIALAYWRRALNIESKADATPVTIADRAIENKLRSMIAEAEPTAAIFGEEFGADTTVAAQSDLWILDPIDGTGAFVTGSPLFGTLIGLVANGAPVLGVIEAPALGERWTAQHGEGAFLNGKRCATSGVVNLSEAALGSTSPMTFSDEERMKFSELSGRVALTRFGGDCYAYALVASGHLDLVVEAGLQPYDYLPLVTVLEEAGGVITDWSGAPLTLNSGGRVVASASRPLHAQALEILNT